MQDARAHSGDDSARSKRFSTPGFLFRKLRWGGGGQRTAISDTMLLRKVLLRRGWREATSKLLGLVVMMVEDGRTPPELRPSRGRSIRSRYE